MWRIKKALDSPDDTKQRDEDRLHNDNILCNDLFHNIVLLENVKRNLYVNELKIRKCLIILYFVYYIKLYADRPCFPEFCGVWNRGKKKMIKHHYILRVYTVNSV